MTASSAPLTTTLLDRPRLDRQLPDACRNWIVDYVAETGSTNADLMARFSDPAEPIRPQLLAWQPMSTMSQTAPSDATHEATSWAHAAAHFPPVVRVAGQQTAGRGRAGRRWWSAPGDSLLFSVGVVMPRPIAGLTGLSLAVGAAVVEGLRQLPIDDPTRLALKWPNDILLDDGKLGGILIETAASSPQASAVVIGIGLNLRGTPTPLSDATETSPRPRSLPPTSLAAALRHADPQPSPSALLTDVLAAVMGTLASMLEQFSASGFAGFQARWWAMHRFAGRAVSIIDGDREQLQGIAVGVDAWGRLLVETTADEQGENETQGLKRTAGQTQRHAVTAGDVSLRVLPSAAQPTPETAPAAPAVGGQPSPPSDPCPR